MAARRIDGKAVAEQVRKEVRARVTEAEASRGFVPHLAVVLASDDPASAVYVRNKGRAAADVGLRSTQHDLDPATPPEVLLELVRALNEDPDVDGILVQLPLPKQHDTELVIRSIDKAKDVDGLHPDNAGRLSRGDEDCLIPCTPQGALRLVVEAGGGIEGRHAVVIGRSRLVGRPMADLLLNRHATVTVCHSRSSDLGSMARSADILIAAVGRPEFVPGDWVKPGATVIDVGINRGTDGKLVGDVDFGAASGRAGAITPVPGGMGPMTIAYLLDNTVSAALRRRT